MGEAGSVVKVTGKSASTDSDSIPVGTPAAAENSDEISIDATGEFDSTGEITGEGEAADEIRAAGRREVSVEVENTHQSMVEGRAEASAESAEVVEQGGLRSPREGDFIRT